MKTLILLSCLFSLSFANDRPVIGVLALELASSPVLRDTYGQSYSSYLPASYVKWIESGGARVMPIKIGQNSNYYRSIMSKINGVLLPGGAADINIQNGYIDNAIEIISIAIEMNLRNDFFPIYAVGIGMTLLLSTTNSGIDESTKCDVRSASISLVFSSETKKSALYKSSSDHIRYLMQNHAVANINTQRCVRLDDFQNSPLSYNWIPVSINTDRQGTNFVSTFEHNVLPLYGTIMHSERASFEWPTNRDEYPHSLATVEVSQYFSNYFVNEARKSNHQFYNDEEALSQLIQNYEKVFSAKDGIKFFELYLFKTDYFG